MSNRLYSKDSMKKPFWYKVPFALSWDEWDTWRLRTKKEYPIQFFVREAASDWAYKVQRTFSDLRYAVKCFFKPYNADVRKAIPRQWADTGKLIIDVNFAIILSFKKEADESHVDWHWTEKHSQFKNWLDSAAIWIQEGYPNLQKQLHESYPPSPLPEHLRGKSYDELYSEVNRIEKLIDETNTNILKQMIEYRDYMWT